jgi:hypothetical protein
MRIFAEQDLQAFLDSRGRQAMNEVDHLQDHQLLGFEEDSIVNQVVSKYEVTPLVLHFDQVNVAKSNAMIPAERFPQGGFYSVQRGTSYRKPVLTYHIPFEGNADLLRYGGTFVSWTRTVNITGSDVTFEFVNFEEEEDGVRRIKGEADHALSEMQRYYEQYDGQVAHFNETLKTVVAQHVKKRRAQAEQHDKDLALLGVPVRRVQSVATTLRVPVARKPVIVSPLVPSKPKSQEWVLSEEVYGEILKLLQDWGVVMEKHPSTYAGKDEEAIRDLFLLLLAPHFDYSEGETFNKSGKTDILIQHEKKPVFVAECKVWHGKEEFLRAVDQLLGYLTWRDSKAALLMFVRNANIQAVVDQIESAMREHTRFVRSRGRSREGWFNFDMRLSEGGDRVVKCAVILLHLEQAKEVPLTVEPTSKKPRKSPKAKP